MIPRLLVARCISKVCIAMESITSRNAPSPVHVSDATITCFPNELHIWKSKLFSACKCNLETKGT